MVGATGGVTAWVGSAFAAWLGESCEPRESWTAAAVLVAGWWSVTVWISAAPPARIAAVASPAAALVPIAAAAPPATAAPPPRLHRRLLLHRRSRPCCRPLRRPLLRRPLLRLLHRPHPRRRRRRPLLPCARAGRGAAAAARARGSSAAAAAEVPQLGEQEALEGEQRAGREERGQRLVVGADLGAEVGALLAVATWRRTGPETLRRPSAASASSSRTSPQVSWRAWLASAREIRARTSSDLTRGRWCPSPGRSPRRTSRPSRAAAAPSAGSREAC